MTKLILKLSTSTTEQVDSSCIDDLYNLTKNNDISVENGSVIEGKINAPISTIKKINILHTLDESNNPVVTGNEGEWDNLFVTASAYAVEFEDPVVEALIQNFLIRRGYGSDLTSSNLSKITNFDRSLGFRSNSEITTLNDLLYLTGCTKFSASPLDNLPNATSIILPPNLVLIEGAIVSLRSIKEIRIPSKVTGNVVIKGCDKLELAVIDASLDTILFDELSYIFSCPNDVVIRGSADSIILYNDKTRTPTTVANIWVPDVSVYSAKSGFADYVGRLKPISEMPAELAQRVSELQ